MTANQYLKSSDFKRSARTASDSMLKLFFKGLTSLIVGTVHFLKDMVSMALGGK